MRGRRWAKLIDYEEFCGIRGEEAPAEVTTDEIEVEELKKRLDRGDQENTPQVFQYRVENSRAVDLARVLTALISGRGAGGLPTAPGTTPVEIGGPPALLRAWIVRLSVP